MFLASLFIFFLSSIHSSTSSSSSISSLETTLPTCGDRNKCIFRFYNNTYNSYSWNLCNLCRNPGSEYTYTDANNHSYYWNIGNVVSQNCYPPWTTYIAAGVLNQFWTPPPVCPNPPDGTCRDPSTGSPVCCTGDCVAIGNNNNGGLIATITPLYNETNMVNGISLFYRGTPPDSSDPFQCSTDPTTGCSAIRTVTFNLFCNPKGSSKNITFVSLTEPKQCNYMINATTKAACSKIYIGNSNDNEDEEF